MGKRVSYGYTMGMPYAYADTEKIFGIKHYIIFRKNLIGENFY